MEERVGLMSNTPLFFSPILNSNNEPSKQRQMLWRPNQPDPSFPKTDSRGASLYSSGWEKGSTNETMQELIGRVQGPFTPLQWMELEHQSLIYKYINAKAPVPLSLLVSICSVDPSMVRYLGNNTVELRHFEISAPHPNNGNMEPGRCRRTDGKKWRCTKSVMPEHKYCERHLVRSRSRKPVEKKNVLGSVRAEPEGADKLETSVSRSSSALLGRPYRSKGKTSTKLLNFEKSSPNSPNTNPIVDTSLKISAFSPVSSNTVLNFFGSSYLKNNSYMSSTSPSRSDSPPHLLQDCIGELTKSSPQLSQSDLTQIDLIGSPVRECNLHVSGVAQVGGPLGEILGHSDHNNINQGNDACYPNAFINSLEWGLG